MNKKIIIKIIFSIVSILSLFFSVLSIINAIKNLSYYNGPPELGFDVSYQISKDQAKLFETYRLIFWIFCCISNILFFLVINIKGLQFVTVSTIQLIKEHKESTKEDRAEKKQAKLAREIAQKQAELEKINENTKKE